MMSFNFSNPTNLYFGSGSLNRLGSLKLPGKKALVLISNGKSTKANGYLDRTLAELKKAVLKLLYSIKSWRIQLKM